MNTQINITLIKNPLEPLKSAVSAPAIYTGGSVIDAIRSVTGDVDPNEIVISVDQMIVEAEFVPKPGSQIIFCVAVRGTGGGGNAQQKGMLRMVAMMAVMIAAPYAAAAMLGTTVAAMGTTGMLLTSGIQLAGALAINALLPPPEIGVAKFQTAEALEKSQNYGWSPGRNAMYEGAILPSIIGERRVTPPCIGAYRYTDDNKQQQYVRMLFAVADDLVEDIEPAHVFINEQVITEYPNASYIHTIGNDIEDQAPEWFDEAITENQHMLDISEQAEVFKEDVNFSNFTEGTFLPAAPYKISKPIEVLTFRCFFPKGMWHLVRKKKSKKSKNENHEGQNEYRWVKERYGGFRVGVQYREVGATSWNLKYFTVTPGKKYNSTFYRTFSVGSITPSNKGYEVQFTVKDPKGMAVEVKSITGRSSLTGVGFVTTKGLNVDKIGVGLLLPHGLHYIKDSGGFGYHEVELVIETRKHGSPTWNGPSDGVSFGDATSAQLRKTYVFENLPPGQYDIRAYVDQAMPTDNRYQHTVMLEYIQESVSHPLVYRGVALLAVDVMATNDLKGQYPVVEVKVRRSDYDPGRASSNPAWAAYYRLIMRGIPENKINLKEFSDWAAFCDLEKLTIALYLDAQLSLQTVLNQIGIAGRGHVVSRGGYWGVIIDMPKTPKQTFSSNNIISGTFSETFLPAHDLANCIVAWFFDETKKYRKTSVEIRDPDIKKASDLKKTEITLYGVTTLEQAKSHAVYMLNHTRMTNRTVSWRSAIDAINCQVGDVIWLQHDVPEWGKTPGRVISADTKSVSCDIPLDFSDTENDTRQFRLCIRHMAPRTGEKTDFIEVRKVTNPYLISSPGNTSVSTFTLDTGETWERVPTRNCPVSIGWVTGTSSTGELLSLKQFRIINIERRTKTQEFNITASEYYADAYIDDYIVTLPNSESGLKPVILPSATSAWDVIGGIEQTYIALSWLGNAPLYYVFFQQKTTTGWSEWAYHTSTTLTSLKIHNLQIGIDYQFSISVDNNPDTGTKLTLFHDKETHEELIEPVTNIKCVQTGTSEWRGRDLDVTWDPFSFFSLKAYRVEILNTLNAVINSEVVNENRYHYSIEKNSHDNGGNPSASVRIRIVVIDDNNNEAVSIAQVMTNSLPTAISNLRTKTGSASQFTGRDLDILWNPSTEEDLKAYEIVISHGTTDLRTEYVATPFYRYTFAMNEEDGAGKASNNIVVKIRVLDAFNQASGITSGTFTNPAPGIPGGLAGEQWMNGIRFLWNPNPEKDITHFEYRLRIEAEAWGPWTPTTNTELQRFLSETESKTYNGKASIAIELRAIDTFGTPSGVATIKQDTGSINVEPTPVDEIGQISGAFKDIPVILGDAWTNNSPAAGLIAWNSHELWHTGVMYDIHTGSTADKYVYWKNASTTYSTSPTEPILAEGDFIIAQNSAGTCILAWDAQANFVIGSAYIKSGAIIDLHVNELSAGKIKAGSIMTPGVYIGGAKYGGGGETLDDLKPAESGANITGKHTSADTRKVAGYGSDLIASSQVGMFRENFENPSNDFIERWMSTIGSMTPTSIIKSPSAASGGSFLRIGDNVGNDHVGIVYSKSIPFDPSKLYRIRCRIRRTAGTGWCNLGIAGRNHDDTAWVNRNGLNEPGYMYYFAANEDNPAATWTEFTGYLKGTGSYGGGKNNNPSMPGVVHTNVRYIRPLIDCNGPTINGTYEIDEFSIDIIPENADQIAESSSKKWAGETGATIGADWKSNLGNIPIRFADTPNANGLYITPDYIGFYNTGAWKSYIGANGHFAFRGNAANFIAWDGLKLSIAAAKIDVNTADGLSINAGGGINIAAGGKLSVSGGEININSGKLSVKTTDGIEVTAGNNIRVLAGGDIHLESSDTDPGTIVFKGITTDISLGMRDSGEFNIAPSSSSANLMFGVWLGTTMRWRNIELNSVESVVERVSNTALGSNGSTALLASSRSASWEVVLATSGLTSGSGIEFNVSETTGVSPVFQPKVNNAVDSGGNFRAWKDIYYYVAHDKRALHLNSRVDSLKILHDMKAMVTRKKDRSGYPILDLKSLPNFLTNADDLRDLPSTQALNSRIFRNTGAFLDVTAAAVRQLDKQTDRKINHLIKRLEKLEMKNARARKTRR